MIYSKRERQCPNDKIKINTEVEVDVREIPVFDSWWKLFVEEMI